MSQEAVVNLEDVSFRYGAVSVLEHVSLKVDASEFASIVGPNGGGKTTLLKIILGIERPQQGQVRLFGGPPRAARTRIGYTPQHTQHDPLFPVSVRDVVLMGRLDTLRKGRYTAKDKAAALDALNEVELADTAARSFAELSGGQRQRALIARALVGRPELLLLDEPTANVDPASETKLLDILQRLNERMTILMVSHDLGFVSSVVRSVICVNRKVVVHPTSDITGEIIRDIYGMDLRMVRHDHRCAAEGHHHG
ncbi:MAG TPA: metal ABC transporter ATP-binding protein [Candidatus Hydrogenedentes bacterium]|nr:metal ABC transporter ATP-binding protein [Candidatus Hydrogenedentota bacterium]HPG66752.1 metal ABC transporter ATP-binding protein [Candidatus Hydrogenedentota bacterium]